MGWRTANIPDQRGNRVVITGANSGIGLETARELARKGATVVMACRSRDKGERAADDIRSDVNDAQLIVETLDLASLESIRAFASRLTDTQIDVLVNNAGVMAVPRQETEDGFEMQLGVNHLGHFALTGLCLESIVRDGRIVTVSSALHERGRIDFDDLHGQRKYERWSAYAQSKLANLLFAYELDRRLEAAGSPLKSVGVHPGYANTNLQSQGPKMDDSRLKLWMMRAANAVFAQSAAMGALPTLYATTAPDVESGSYYGPDGLFGMRGTPKCQQSSKASRDRETARHLWERSEELTGVEYRFSSSDTANSRR